MENKKMMAMGLIMLLGIVALMNIGAALSSGLGTPYPVRGYVVDSLGSPVAGATVTLNIQGSVGAPATFTSEADGWYEIDASVLNPSAGDILVLHGIHSTQVGTLTFDVNYSVDREQNLTLTTPVGPLPYNMTVFTFDANGTGLTGVAVSFVNALGTYYNTTTNSTGQATLALPIGSYTYKVGTLRPDLFNRTGTLSIVDRDVALNIDMSRAQSEDLSVLGLGLSTVCMFMVAVVFIVGLLWLFMIVMKGRK